MTPKSSQPGAASPLMAGREQEQQRHYSDYRAFMHALKVVIVTSAIVLLSMAYFLL